MNDFGWPLKAPNHPLYLNPNSWAHTFPTRPSTTSSACREHTVRHARVHDQLASDPQYAGGIAWCAFDYNTHSNFGSGDRICYHGVTDIFREAQASGRLLSLAVRSGRGDCPGARLPLGARR